MNQKQYDKSSIKSLMPVKDAKAQVDELIGQGTE